MVATRQTNYGPPTTVCGSPNHEVPALPQGVLPPPPSSVVPPLLVEPHILANTVAETSHDLGVDDEALLSPLAYQLSVPGRRACRCSFQVVCPSLDLGSAFHICNECLTHQSEHEPLAQELEAAFQALATGLQGLPTEVLVMILRRTAPSVVAGVCRLSKGWLKVAGPILYEHIVVDQQSQFERLARKARNATLSPSVGPFVAFRQVKSFTLARNPYHLCPPGRNDFGCEALPGSAVDPLSDGVIPVDLLVVDLRGHPSLANEPLLKDQALADPRYVLDRWDVLALFNPKELRVLGDPLSSRVSDDPGARKALDAYRISAGDCYPGKAHAVDFLTWGRLEQVLFVNTVCHNLAYLKVPISGQKRVNVIVDLSRQDLVQMPDSSFRWSKEPRTPVSEAAQHSAVTSALSIIRGELRAERVDGMRENRHQPPQKRWLNASLLGHVTILVANEEQVQEAEELISWHDRTNVSQRSTAEFFNLVQSKTICPKLQGVSGCTTLDVKIGRVEPILQVRSSQTVYVA